MTRVESKAAASELSGKLDNTAHVKMVYYISYGITSRCRLNSVKPKNDPSMHISWDKLTKKEITERGPTSRRCWSRSGCRQRRWRSEAEHSQTSLPPLGRSRCPCFLVLLSHCEKEPDTKETINSIGKTWLHCFVCNCWELLDKKTFTSC